MTTSLVFVNLLFKLKVTYLQFAVLIVGIVSFYYQLIYYIMAVDLWFLMKEFKTLIIKTIKKNISQSVTEEIDQF